MNTQTLKTWLAILALASTQVALPAFAQSKRPGKQTTRQPNTQEGNANAAAALSVEGYLEQVRQKNQSFTAAQSSAEGATLRSEEYKLLTRPNLIANANYVNDQRETGSPLQGTGNKAMAFSLGVQQQTDFGLSGTLSYNYSNIEVLGVPPQFLPEPNYYLTGPVLELQYSLLRNGSGRETRATQEMMSAQALAAKYSQSFRQTQLLADAEVTYWNLSIAREQVLTAQDAVERAKRQQEWNTRRQRSGLVDRAELLQANTALLQRQMELQRAMDAERSIARSFNTVRGVNSDVVPEVLPTLDATAIEKLQIPKRVEFRDDVRAAEQQKRIAEANSKSGIERNRPTLNLVGSVGLNGRDPSSGTAISESMGTSHPNYSVGVRLMMPLDLETLKRDREGYAKEVSAAEMSYQRTVFEQERLWNEHLSAFKDSIERYKLAAEIEKAQEEKVDYERKRHQRGRSTTDFVIRFEGELAGAQFARAQAQAEVLNAYARLKSFGGGQ